MVEHGYHVSRSRTRTGGRSCTIGVRLVDFDRYHFLGPGQYPKKITVRVGAPGIGAILHNTFKGLLPPPRKRWSCGSPAGDYVLAVQYALAGLDRRAVSRGLVKTRKHFERVCELPQSEPRVVACG